jgi:membrane protein CcdC involved in cytochrome C biogenesis
MTSSENGHYRASNGRSGDPLTYDSFTGTGNSNKKPTESHFLWWCAGAYQDILRDCPSEHTKYAGLGGVLLATFVLAALSSGYAVYSVFYDAGWAICFAIVWGLIIFNFDRFLVSTMRKYGVSRRKQIWMSIPRIFLALLIGFTIARPLELKIFEKEIDVQVIENRHKKILLNDSLLQAESRSTLYAAQMERDRLTSRQFNLEDSLHRLQQSYVQEADGTGGSRRRGVDQLTRLKQQAYLNALQQHTPELLQLQQQVHYQDSLIKAANAGRKIRSRQYELQVAAGVGFLERNKALSDLASRESSIYWSVVLISLLIILIEIGPILSKLIMSTGPYDLALARTELLQMAVMQEEIRNSRGLTEQLKALQKKQITEELDQWERGEDKIPSRPPLQDVVRRIRERYDFSEEDVL